MSYNIIKVLFLSSVESHKQMFLQIIKELEYLTNGRIESRIIDTHKIEARPPSIRIIYKREINHVRFILETIKPNILIMANDQGIHTTFIRISKLMRIPSLVIQDGILSEMKARTPFEFLKWRDYLPWQIISLFTNNNIVSKLLIRLGRQWAIPCWGTGGADKVAVMGDYYRKVFVSRGVSPDKIIVTGYPLLDIVPSYRAGFCVNKFFQELKIQADSPLILLITQPFVEDGIWTLVLRNLFIECIVNAVKHVKGQLIIKLHPRDNFEVYNTLIKKYHNIKIIVIKDFNLHELLLASDVIVTVNSTVGLWALAYDKPLLVMSCFPCDYKKNILEDMTLSVKEMNELPKALSLLLKDVKQYKNIISKTQILPFNHLYKLDGKASERVSRLILKMIKRNSSIFLTNINDKQQ